jgi:rSAM/selenodomain-associated transferase 2
MRLFVLSLLSFCSLAVCMAAGGPVGKWGLHFALLYGLAFVFLAAMVRFFPNDWGVRRTFWVGLLSGIFLRLLFLWFPPNLDVNRYVWEGYIQSLGFNPYTLSPNDPMLSALAAGPLQEIWQGINHKEFSACYPPLAMLLFRLLAAVRPDPLFFKIVMALFDIAVLLPLAAILKRYSLPPVRLLWYAANPLLLVFIAGEGHLDSLMVFLLCLGIALVFNHKARWGFFCIGGAVMTKYFAGLAILFLIRKNNWKKTWPALLPFMLYLPFLDAGSGLFRSCTVFGSNLHYNDSLTAVLRPFLGAGTIPMVGFILVVALGVIFLTVHDRLRSLMFAFGCLLICLPTLHPWYLALIVPFAATFQSPAWLFLQAAVVFTFPVLVMEYATGVFQEVHWLKYFEYVPFFGFLIWGLFRGGANYGRRFEKVGTLSIVVPTLNEGNRIGGCLRALSRQSDVSEVIVADGGSKDNTVEIVKCFGAVVVYASRGRGIQIQEGIKRATGDVILILHADCRLRNGICRRILDKLNQDRGLSGGAVSMTFDPGGGRKRIIAVLNNLRARFAGVAFGDQGQFLRSEILPLIGGFPDQMLMEDVELSLRLKESGRVAFLSQGIAVSGRRWENRSFMSNVIMVLRLFFRYLIERRLGLAPCNMQDYYHRYYGDSEFKR